MNLPDVRSTRRAIAAMTYDGTDSIRGAAELRQRMAATVDLARRARVDARDHLWNAREAERALGRMILAAREAGDLAAQGQRADGQQDIVTLDVLGISNDLAAHAVTLARVPDEVWTAWHDWDADPTQTAVGRSARGYQAQIDTVKAEAEQARQEARRLAARKAEIERELSAVAERPKRATPVDVPPLTDDDTATFDADITVSAAAVPEPTDDRDRINGDRWLALMRRLEQLITALEQQTPPLPDDHFADLTVLSARDLAHRITVRTATWIREVNRQYTERIAS